MLIGNIIVILIRIDHKSISCPWEGSQVTQYLPCTKSNYQIFCH